MALIFSTFYARPDNSIRATLEGRRTTIRAEVAAENIYPENQAPYTQDGGRILCSAHVHGITNPAQYAKNRAQQQQAEEAERGQHLEKQLSSAAALLDVRAKSGRSTDVWSSSSAT